MSIDILRIDLVRRRLFRTTNTMMMMVNELTGLIRSTFDRLDFISMNENPKNNRTKKSKESSSKKREKKFVDFFFIGSFSSSSFLSRSEQDEPKPVAKAVLITTENSSNHSTVSHDEETGSPKNECSSPTNKRVKYEVDENTVESIPEIPVEEAPTIPLSTSEHCSLIIQ